MPAAGLISLEGVVDDDVAACVEAHARSRYLVDPPFAAQPRAAYLTALIRQAAAGSEADGRGLVCDGELRGLVVIRLPRWDLELFGHPVGRLEFLVADGPATARTLAEWAVARMDAADAPLSSARVAVDDLDVLAALEDAGYRYRESIVVPWLRLADWTARPFELTRPTQLSDIPAIAAIAERVFTTDRFHMDERVPRHLADALYRRWVIDWHDRDDPDEHSRVLEVDGVVRGFIMYRRIASPHLVARGVCDLVLAGIDPDCVGKGLGRAMYAEAISDSRAWADYCSAVITTRNTAVANMDFRLGFRLSCGGEVTLHRWR